MFGHGDNEHGQGHSAWRGVVLFLSAVALIILMVASVFGDYDYNVLRTIRYAIRAVLEFLRHL